MSKKFTLAAFSVAFAAAAAAPASFAQSGTVKVAWIDPLSGMMAPVGQNQLRSWQHTSPRSPTGRSGAAT